MKEKQKTNRVLTIVLILGTVTVFFPLYMAAIIAFKKPSGGCTFFPETMEFRKLPSGNGSDRFLAFSWKQFTDHSGNDRTGNSDPLDCRLCDRAGHGKKKKFPFYLSVYCQWYVCSIFHLNDASGKTDGAYGTWKPRGCHSVVSGILHANECPALQWIFKKYSGSTRRSSRY